MTDLVVIDVIIPVFNAAGTIEEAVRSAMAQIQPLDKNKLHLRIQVCCYDDGSSDESWIVLQRLVDEFACLKTSTKDRRNDSHQPIESTLLTARSSNGKSRGAGFARNRAVALGESATPTSGGEETGSRKFLCMLDSDDVMHPRRVYEQTKMFLSMEPQRCELTLLGCTFARDPPDSTWHYAKWANELTDERLYLEKFRELTLLQPTWMISHTRFDKLGGYIEAPASDEELQALQNKDVMSSSSGTLRLVHPVYDTVDSMRVAEDLRFFHTHLQAGGHLQLLRSASPLLTYRHRAGQSQSSQTPRRLLMQLRVLALEQCVLRVNRTWRKFCVWGAGRDGKDFIKALSPDVRQRVACIADVDARKIASEYYENREIKVKIPIVHISLLARDSKARQELQKQYLDHDDSADDPGFGRISKDRPSVATSERPKKKVRLPSLSAPKLNNQTLDSFQELPIVVCVAMYRTGGALEHNVGMVGRTEGKDLWHLS